MQSYFALITVLDGSQLPHPAHPIVIPPMQPPGGGQPPDSGGGQPPWYPGHPAHPIVPRPEHPIVIPPDQPPPPWWPGRPEHPIPPQISHPIVIPPNPDIPPEQVPDIVTWKVAWTEQTGWIVVGVPNTDHPVPSQK